MTFVTDNQIIYFLYSFLFGFFIGPIFLIPYFFKKKYKSVPLGIIADISACVIISFIYVIFCYLLRFPNIRIFLPFSVVIGVAVCTKSFNLLLAKAIKKV